MELYLCKCSNNAGPQFIKVLHEAHVSVISILQNQTLEGPCIIFCNIYIHSNEIHNVAALIVY